MTKAVALYQGELLAGFGVEGAPAFEEWLLLYRERGHQQVMVALHALVQAHEPRGNDAPTHLYASRQLALDPAREEAHRQLMRSLARHGLHTKALDQFEACRPLLQSALSAEPTAETLACAEQIRYERMGNKAWGVGSTEPPFATPIVQQDWEDAPTLQSQTFSGMPSRYNESLRSIS